MPKERKLKNVILELATLLQVKELSIKRDGNGATVYYAGDHKVEKSTFAILNDLMFDDIPF
jgi:hypothetical protein